jgi:hypothetical protein
MGVGGCRTASFPLRNTRTNIAPYLAHSIAQLTVDVKTVLEGGANVEPHSNVVKRVSIIRAICAQCGRLVDGDGSASEEVS